MTHPIIQHFGQVIHHDDTTPKRNNTGPGHCTLVSAGAGDPELLTVKAVKAIQMATMLLVDDLVSDAVVALASPSARVIHLGKRGGLSTPQAFIEKLIIMAVSEGEQVVQLKGGDPFVFGRSGEEMAHLQGAGISVSVANSIQPTFKHQSTISNRYNPRLCWQTPTA